MPVEPAIATLLARASELAETFARTAAEIDREARFPHANFDRLHEAGLLSLPIPRAAGGAGLGLGAAQAVVGAIARGEPATALVLTMHYIQHAAIANDADFPTELRGRLQRESVAGVALVNALHVEPDLGSPSRGGVPRTIARQTTEGWQLSGRKIYSTGAPRLSWLAVYGVTDEPQPRVGLFFVDASRPGVRIVETWNATGMRATGSHDVVLEDVLVDAGHVANLVPAGGGEKSNPLLLQWYFGLVSALYLGVARAARDWLVDFLDTRTPTALGAPLSSLARVQEAVGGFDLQLGIGAQLLDLHARRVEEGSATGEAAGVLKHFAVDTAVDITARALDLAGNHGLSRDNPLERHHRDALCARIHAPQNDLLRVKAGQAAFAARRAQNACTS
ncbi:MAG TPA: acyl-CoA dehydrogenase family protein [Novosphingobium sp.]|nr:acyl-CoA dehydrogenase family protein [Novosphingobium sp.]